MRMILTMATTALAITSLAACGQSDQQFRNTARAQLLAGCNGADASARAQMTQAGVDVSRYCTCAIDRYMQGASSEQLKQLSRNPGSAASDPGMERAAEQCVREQMPANVVTNLTMEPARDNVITPEPAAPAEGAAAEGGENGAAEH